ncbi:MAG: hypothetical protein AAF224_13555 [Pseudomonadota bacterium]
MLRNFIEKLALPGFVAAIAAGAALAAAGDPAPKLVGAETPVTTLEAEEVQTHAETLFRQADLDKNGDLDRDEFAALSIVVAELSRLNGFVAILDGDSRSAAPIAPAPSLTIADRIRIDAVAAREHAIAAGADARLDLAEYVGLELNRFAAADRNRNGVLKAGELFAYTHETARIPSLNG